MHPRWSIAIGIVLVIGGLIGLATAISPTDDRRGTLRVVTHPHVGAEISVDGVPRSTNTIVGLPLAPGVHLVCFGHVENYLAPDCREIQLGAGATAVVETTYEPAGILHVTVTPADLSPRIEVDGIARDITSITIPVSVGTHQVCAEELDGFEPPTCVEVEVPASQKTSVTLRYVPTTHP